MEDVLRIRARLHAVNAGDREAEIVLRVPLKDPIVGKLIGSTGAECLVGIIVDETTDGVAARGRGRSEQTD